MFVLAETLRSHRRWMVVVASVAAVAMAAAGWLGTHAQAVAPPVLVTETADPPAPETVLVFVSGAVEHPGLYALSPAARVADAVAAAGGMTSLADPGHLPNLAARVHDGRQVNVPFLKQSSLSTLKLDINSAAQDELEAVPDMPPGLAAAIVQYREEWGPFTSMSQLRTDLGVDSQTVSEIGQYVRVVPPIP